MLSSAPSFYYPSVERRTRVLFNAGSLSLSIENGDIIFNKFIVQKIKEIRWEKIIGTSYEKKLIILMHSVVLNTEI